MSVAAIAKACCDTYIQCMQYCFCTYIVCFIPQMQHTVTANQMRRQTYRRFQPCQSATTLLKYCSGNMIITFGICFDLCFNFNFKKLHQSSVGILDISCFETIYAMHFSSKNLKSRLEQIVLNYHFREIGGMDAPDSWTGRLLNGTNYKIGPGFENSSL